ncbi:MAG: hypothetical protein ACLPY1_02320 [Terracidiphilus sp.]
MVHPIKVCFASAAVVIVAMTVFMIIAVVVVIAEVAQGSFANLPSAIAHVRKEKCQPMFLRGSRGNKGWQVVLRK